MTPGGLRERKKLKTREAIQREAMRLFQKQGYDETTIEQISAAVEISASTFFNYFPTKEDVVLFDRYDPMVVSMMLSRPTNEPLSVVVRQALEGLAGVFERDRDMILARAKLAVEVPALRARFFEEIERDQDLFSGIIGGRTGRDPADFELRVLGMVLISAVYEASREWVRRGGQGSLVEPINQALDMIEMGARLDAL